MRNPLVRTPRRVDVGRRGRHEHRDAVLLQREIVEVGLRRLRAGSPLVIPGLVRHEGSDELGERLPDPLFGNLTIAKGAREERGIRRVARERLDDPPQVLSHLDPALDRQQHHLLEVAGPFVPEESRTLVIADVDQRHRAAIRPSAVKSPAEGLGVAKPVRLHVARPARCRRGRRA